MALRTVSEEVEALFGYMVNHKLGLNLRLHAFLFDALQRIFNLCDSNKDGLLDSTELNEFQVRLSFSPPRPISRPAQDPRLTLTSD